MIYVDKTSGSVKVSRKALLEKESCINKPDEYILRPKHHVKALITDDASVSIEQEEKMKPISAMPKFPTEPPLAFNRNFFQ